MIRQKIRSDCFAARLTLAQQDELFDALAAGLGYHEAGERVRGWMQANDAAGLNGDRPGREIMLPTSTIIGRWYRTTVLRRRYERAKEAVMAAQEYGPEDYETQCRRALVQARYLATLEGLKVTEIAALERNELLRDKLALEREKMARDRILEQAQQLLDRTTERDKGPELQRQINLALQEIERMKHGEPV